MRFQAEHSNALWHFNLSPSDLKHVEDVPAWVEPGRGAPMLMIYSAVDERSGVAYQEYRCVYGEDVEAGLRFLFNAMAPKSEEDGSPFGGISAAIYCDNGPISRSGVFQRVMERIGVAVSNHLPAGSDGRRTTASSKGKVERPFRTVKEAHESLYHFHKPQNEAEANLWFRRYLAGYNGQRHRSEPPSRLERFCAFAREPERRAVGGDARVSVAGTLYEVDADLAGETVLLWWGLFDQDLYVEHGDTRFGPYHPVGGPVPLHHYRQHKKGKREKRADRVAIWPAHCRCRAHCWMAILAWPPPQPAPLLPCRGRLSPTLTPTASSPTRTASPPSSPSRRRSGCRLLDWRRRSGPSSTPCWPKPWNAAPC